MKNFQLVIFVLFTIQCMTTFSALLKNRGSIKNKYDPEAYDDPYLNGNANNLPPSRVSAAKLQSGSAIQATLTTEQSNDSKDSKDGKKDDKKEEKKEVKKPGGPTGQDDSNEIPFVRQNQKYINSTVVTIDPTLKYVYNKTLPTTFLRADSNFPTNLNFRVIDQLTQNINIDRDLARLRITVLFPEVGDHRFRFNGVLMLFFDDKLVGESSYLHYSDNNNNNSDGNVPYNKYFYEPVELKGIIYNVRSKMHKLSIGIRHNKMSNTAVNNGDGLYLDYNMWGRSYLLNHHMTDVIDRKFAPGINFYLEGEVLKLFTYEDK